MYVISYPEDKSALVLRYFYFKAGKSGLATWTPNINEAQVFETEVEAKTCFENTRATSYAKAAYEITRVVRVCDNCFKAIRYGIKVNDRFVCEECVDGVKNE